MKKRVLFLLLITLILVLFTSCSTDENQARVAVNNNFVMNGNTEFSFVAIRINDHEGHTLHNYEYQEVQDISLNIIDGSEIIIYVVEPDYFDYQYVMYNNGEIEFEGIQYGHQNSTLIKQY